MCVDFVEPIDSYDNCYIVNNQVDNYYVIFWSIVGESLHMSLVGSTQGWVAFGINVDNEPYVHHFLNIFLLEIDDYF